MDEGHSGNNVNIVAGSNGSGANGNVRRGDYFVLGFIGVLLVGVTAYLVLNPEESTLRSGMEVEKGNAHKLVHEPVASHALVHEPAKQDPVLSSPPVSELVEPGSEVVKPEVMKREVVKPVMTSPEVTNPEVVRPEVTKPEVVKVEVVRPEVVKPEAVKPEATKPEATKPEATKPEATKPEATKPEATKPEATKPEATKPEVTKPEVTKPTEAQPEVASASDHKNTSQVNSTVWAVNLVSYSRLDSARKAIAQLKSEGVDTEFVEVSARGHRYYRVRIPNLASRQEAARLYAEFRNRPEYEGVWIGPYRKSAEN